MTEAQKIVYETLSKAGLNPGKYNIDKILVQLGLSELPEKSSEIEMNAWFVHTIMTLAARVLMLEGALKDE